LVLLFIDSAALEKSKYVYVLNRDQNMNLTISSPLESNKNLTMCFSMVGMDVGFENPCFACLELDCGESDLDTTGQAFVDIEKLLTLYELDLGLNHVVRKWSNPVPRTANHLVAVPGGKDGPSGVLVCSEGLVTWVHPDYKSVRIPIPQRPNSVQAEHDANGNYLSQAKVIIANSVVHRLKRNFFILLQTELGDVFKMTLEYTHGKDGNIGQVSNMKIRYFETLSVGIQMCLLKSGFLFLAAEFGNQ
jgi:splicing factor 3B subunit 3